MNKHVPHAIKTKKDRQVNPILKQYVMSWVWRHNHKEGDGFKIIGERRAYYRDGEDAIVMRWEHP